MPVNRIAAEHDRPLRGAASTLRNSWTFCRRSGAKPSPEGHRPRSASSRSAPFSERVPVLDLNFAYHPSCRYDDRWRCPLAPAGNTIAARVEAGERL